MKEKIDIFDYENQNARRYSEIAYDYKRDWRGELTPDLIEKYDVFLDDLGPGKHCILDAGCGTGKATDYFTKKGHSVSCLDIAKGMLSETMGKKTVEGQTIGIQANMKSLPYGEESFDGIWTMAAMVHLSPPDRAIALREFRRVLKQDGTLFLSVQNKLNPKHIQRILQSYVFRLGYNESNNYYRNSKTIKEILEGPSLVQRVHDGYALLDDRHWFFPTRMEISKFLTKTGFSIIKTDQLFDKRIDILARKT